MLYGLPKPFRLHLKKDFEAIIRNAYRLQGEGMVIWWRPSSYPGARTRLGIVVSRKLGGAVVRNRVKRLLRESFRLNREKLKPGTDLIVSPRSSEILADVHSAQRALLALCGKAGILHSSDNL
ncbi:ribonuclease P protein component [Candidatus Avelusimicrobium aviculae]|uniref:ribonuclease P protein component n=1 Tax=Candidatus Avelusimicrobium aviculae TaxID=3416206 RepID=UPI003D0F5E85